MIFLRTTSSLILKPRFISDCDLHHPHPQRGPGLGLRGPHRRVLPLPEELRPEGHHRRVSQADGAAGLPRRLQHVSGFPVVGLE